MLRHIVMSWRHSVTLCHNHICKYRINDIFERVNPKYYRNKKKNHLASTSTSWDRNSMFNDVMTSFRDVIPSCIYDDNNHVEFNNQRNHRNEIKSALEHICRLGWRQFVSWRHVIILVTSWRHVMTWKHHASTYTILAWNPAIEIITGIHVYHHFRTSTNWYSEICDVMTSRQKNHLCNTSTSWDRVPPVFDVMTWRHDVTSSCKYKTDNIFELSNPKKQKKNHLSSTSTSWDRENKYGCVMLWCHDVTVSRGWVKSKSLNCILWMGPGAMEKWHF